MHKAAILSSCGTYRYTLDRDWDKGPRALFIMLNPSTADDKVDDPTIRRCISFAKREGCGGLRVINLYSARTPSPKELAKMSHPHGPTEAHHVSSSITEATGPVICAWGADPMAKSVSDYMLSVIRI